MQRDVTSEPSEWANCDLPWASRARGPWNGWYSTGMRRWPGGPADLGRARFAGADLVRSGRDAGAHHAVHGALRAARRDGEADAGQALAPCLAESWSASEDGLSYNFVLREGAKFHNGEPVTAEDVKFSFERYRGAARH